MKISKNVSVSGKRSPPGWDHQRAGNEPANRIAGPAAPDRAFCKRRCCSKIVVGRVCRDQRRCRPARGSPLDAFLGTSGVGHVSCCCSAKFCLGGLLVGAFVKCVVSCRSFHFVSLCFVSFCFVRSRPTNRPIDRPEASEASSAAFLAMISID